MKLLNYGAITGVWLSAVGHHLVTGDTPQWWWGYTIGATLVALINIFELHARERA